MREIESRVFLMPIRVGCLLFLVPPGQRRSALNKLLRFGKNMPAPRSRSLNVRLMQFKLSGALLDGSRKAAKSGAWCHRFRALPLATA